MSSITYANEKHLVEEFMKFTNNNRIILPNNESVHLFIWGYELWLSEGGKSGGSGRIDLIGTDDTGNVWLIEAKTSDNFELKPSIWGKQVLNYREALSSCKDTEISLKTSKYLLGDRNSVIVPSFIDRNCESLFDAFCNWTNFIGKDNTKATELYIKTILNIQHEQVISTILSDIYIEEIMKQKPDDGNSYGYFIINGVEDECKVEVFLDSVFYPEIKDDGRKILVDHNWKKEWNKLAKRKLNKDSLESLLFNDVMDFFRDSIQNLEYLGWNGTPTECNKNAIVIDMKTEYGADVRIHLGVIDKDAKIPRKYKIPGSQGLKFNIDFRHFKKSGDEKVREKGWELAEILSKETNYKVRTKRKDAPINELTEDEKNSWNGEMLRWKTNENRDYIGGTDEKEDFDAAWTFLKKIISNVEILDFFNNESL